MTIDLYYSSSSAPCRSVMLTAEALHIKLNLIKINMLEKENLKPEFLKFNPQHTIPTMVDDGFSLWESRAIMRYLVNKYAPDSPLYPKDPKARAVVDQRLDFDMGTLYHRFGQYTYPQYIDGTPPDEKAFKKLLEALEFLDTFLKGHEYAAGSELTIGDFALVTTISNIDMSGIDLSKYTNIVKWYDLVKSTAPGYQEVNQKGIDELKLLLAKFKAMKANNSN